MATDVPAIRNGASVTPKLEEIIETFQTLDREMRLELLLDYSKKLPPLPEKHQAARDAGLHRVPECMTPVFLWVEVEGDVVHLHVDVAEEAPTVKGYLSILVHALDGASAREILEIPNDLLHRFGLAGVIRMNRALGLSAILARIKHETREAAGLTPDQVN